MKIEKISKEKLNEINYKVPSPVIKAAKKLNIGESLMVTEYKMKSPLPQLIQTHYKKGKLLENKRMRTQSFKDEKNKKGWIVTRIK
jgi:hypothetical protein